MKKIVSMKIIKTNTAKNGNELIYDWSKLINYRIRLITLLVILLVALSGCGKNNPNPVEKKDGMVFIPINDTAFLIPEKTWLTSVANKSTDGTVCCFDLHATIPDVQPWSKERHDEMYWGAGPGKKLIISVRGNKVYLHKHFYEVPHSTMYTSKFIEEKSSQSGQGLRQFRKLNPEHNEETYKRRIRRYGIKFANEMKKEAGKPYMGTVYFEKIENNKVKYFISCSETNIGLFSGCNLRFLWSTSLEVNIDFIRRNINQIVSMADKVTEKLKEFESAGLVYQKKGNRGQI